MRPRMYLLFIAVAMMVASVVVLIINRDLPTELLGGIAFLGALAVIINTVLDLTGNGKDKQ